MQFLDTKVVPKIPKILWEFSSLVPCNTKVHDSSVECVRTRVSSSFRQNVLLIWDKKNQAILIRSEKGFSSVRFQQPIRAPSLVKVIKPLRHFFTLKILSHRNSYRWLERTQSSPKIFNVKKCLSFCHRFLSINNLLINIQKTNLDNTVSLTMSIRKFSRNMRKHFTRWLLPNEIAS